MPFSNDRRRIEIEKAGCTCAICMKRREVRELNVHSRSGQHRQFRRGESNDALVVCANEVDGGDSCHRLLHEIEEVIPRKDWGRLASRVETLTRWVVQGITDVPQARAALRRSGR